MKLPSERQYPKRIYLGNYTYTVRFVSRLPKDTVGEADPVKCEIRILKGLGPKARLTTYVHEVLHAMEFSFDINLPHKLVRALEEPLVDFFLQNF